MPIPIVPTSTVLQFVPKGYATQPADMENVLYGLYQVGLSPTPGGVRLDTLVANFLTAWGGFWTPFIGVNSGFQSCTGRIVDGFVGTGGHKYKLTVTQLWTVNNVITGTVAGTELPAFAAFSVEKRLAVSGRGRQGQTRMWGVPETSCIGDSVDPAIVATLQTALDTSGWNFLVGGVGNSDNVQVVVINGKLVNSNPGQPSPFYVEVPAQLLLNTLIGSQITRKFLRRRK